VFYSVDLTIPAATLEAAPATERITMEFGRISAVHVVIPPGVAGLAFTNCRRANHQIFPTNPGSFLTGDGSAISWAEQYDLDDEPRTLTLRGWSPNARFAHTITWRFEVQSLDVAAAAGEQAGLVRRIYEGIFGRD